MTPTSVETTQPVGGIPDERAPRRRLVVVYSPDRAAVGGEIPLDGETWVIGRTGRASVRISDPAISSTHLECAPTPDGGYLVEDLRTKNGTFISRRRLTHPETLSAGDVISLGSTLLVVDLEPDDDELPYFAGARDDETSEYVGSSYSAKSVRRSISTIARMPGPVLIFGETGTGKEVVANAIHRLGHDASAPWIPVNCAAIPKDMAEAELFGYERGAFTGAWTHHDGYFVQADGGSIFLDELGEIPLSTQAKLLRVLEDGVVQPLKSPERRTVRVRTIAATNVDPESGAMRPDLMMRLARWVLCLPSLAERRTDILELFDHFRTPARSGEVLPPLTAAAAEALLLYAWPGNVRELQNVARRLAANETGRAVEVTALPRAVRQALREPGFEPADRDPRILGLTERRVPSRNTLKSLLQASDGNISAVAEGFGWHRTQVARWIKRYRIPIDAIRTEARTRDMDS